MRADRFFIFLLLFTAAEETHYDVHSFLFPETFIAEIVKQRSPWSSHIVVRDTKKFTALPSAENIIIMR